jgi:CheY-like chemotaxis protein
MTDHLAVIGHELRTPLTAIVGFASMLREDLANDHPAAEKAEIILENAQHLLRVIEGVLECARAGDGRLVPSPAPCSPWMVAAEVVRSLSGVARARNLALALDADSPLPEMVVTDRMLLRQILVNLIGNALRYTSEGGVRVALDVVDEPGGRRLRCAVNDTGPGMTAQQVAQLFQPFERAGRKDEGGSGLGLWISSQLARLLDGRITVASAPGAGSCFRLDLPLAADAALVELTRLPDPTTPAGGQVHQGSLGGYRILVVDDVETNQLMMSALLKRHGASVTIAINGRQACETALEAERENRPFALVVMDIRMPVMDGCQATRALREAGYARPIVACSANMTADDQRGDDGDGFDGYVAKPVQLDRFLTTINALLRRRPPG